MTYQAILFDLDGTLLPMDNEHFTKSYFKLLAKYAAPFGYQPETLIPAMWKGVEAMVKNDGSRLNYDAFWETFAQLLGPQVKEHIPAFDRFYGDEFQQAVHFTTPNPLAVEAVSLARQKAQKVILATNPLFPPVAVDTRLSWVGLHSDDFDLVTHYLNSSRCKPNPDYYRDILTKFNLTGDQCLMVGNDVQEDIEAAGSVGLNSFLVTDCFISRYEMPTCPQGSFEDLVCFLSKL